jgi:hypothetical protein
MCTYTFLDEPTWIRFSRYRHLNDIENMTKKRLPIEPMDENIPDIDDIEMI